jgi:hypothetical protein
MLRVVVNLLLQNWALVAAIAAVFFAFWLSRVAGPEGRLPYEKRPSLLTQAELRFLRALQAAVGGSWAVFAMVRMADLLKVPGEVPGAQSYRNKIFGKHLDFVLCDNDSLEARLAIELDDSSHQRQDRKERDEFVNEALACARLPLLRISVAENYDKVELRKVIDRMLA